MITGSHHPPGIRAGMLFAALGALLLPALALAAPARPESDRSEVSRAVFPPQRIELRFFHDRHLGTGILECGDCHPAATSKASSDRLIPGHATCGKCHAVEPPTPATVAPPGAPDPMLAFYGAPPPEAPAPPSTDCSLCHPRVKRGLAPVALTLPAPNLHFPHAAHLKKGVDCARCHGEVARLELATRQDLPTMEVCLECHVGGPEAHTGSGKASGACTTCHPSRPGGGLRTDFPSGRLVPTGVFPGIAHGEAFALEHALPSRANPELCATCHQKSECLDCHAGSSKPFDLHPADWLSLHPMAARQDTLTCSGCHRAQSFCITCHERSGIGRDAPTGRVRGTDPLSGPTFRAPLSNLRVHPSGWADLDATTSPDHHSTHARRNIETCVSCHREETCLGCHASFDRGGLGVSPHPPSVLTRCESLFSATPRACAKCHATEGGSPCP